MNAQNRDRKTTAGEGRPSVLGSKDEFLHPEHKASSQPSHQMQEMSKPTDKSQEKASGQSRPRRG